MDFQLHRPPGFEGAADRHLDRMMGELTGFLIDAQADLATDTLRLPEAEVETLAAVLVEFAEDLHNDIGLWHSLEAYQRDFFGTPLPLILRPGEQATGQDLFEARVRYLLLGLYLELKPDLVVAPTHRDLQELAAQIAEFLAEAIAHVPRGSGIKQFLAQHNRFGWDVKRKLVWLGQHAYLFRHPFWNYIEAQDDQPDMATVDDFICQETTIWAGLGAIDILAGTLNLSREQRDDLRSWYERHMAFYRVIRIKRTQLHLQNLINDQRYRVRMDNPGDAFKVGQFVFGSLVPWEGFWYWSGPQKLYKDLPPAEIEKIKRSFFENMPNVVYRYDRERLQMARELIEDHYRNFVNYYDDELAVFADGRSMAAELQSFFRRLNEERLAEMPDELRKEYGSSPTVPEMPYPPEVLDNQDGVGVFFNRGEGTELMIGFNEVIGALEKKGRNLTEDESESLYALITSDSISPAFVQRLVKEYGAEAIATAFFIHDRADETFLPYLLRRYKGEHFRNRYPQLSIA